MPVSLTSNATRTAALARAPLAQAQRDAAALGELDRIADQVEQHLLQALRVAEHPIDGARARGRAPAPGPCSRHWRETAPPPRRRWRAATSAHASGSACRPRSSSGRARRSGSPSASRRTTPRCAPACAAAASSCERRSRSSAPSTPFIGVRISWLIVARNCDLATLAASADSLALLQRGVRRVGFETVVNGTSRGVAEFPRSPHDGHAEDDRQHRQRQRPNRLVERLIAINEPSCMRREDRRTNDRPAS